MELDVRAAAGILQVPESTIYRWIQEGNLPAREINGQYRFSRAELLEWATVRRIRIPGNLFQEGPGTSTGPRLSDALEAGGFAYGVGGSDRDSVLQAVVQNLNLPPGYDRQPLLYLLLAREALGSTAVGDGIAIPHPRHPLILPVGRPLLHLSFLAHPIDFKASDRIPVHTLFLLACPTVRTHLQMLARIASLLRDDTLRQTICRQPPPDQILAAVRRAEEALEQKPAGDGGPSR